MQFCLENQLKILNTFFKKKIGKRWTWISPNMECKRHTDYMLTTVTNREMKSFDVVSGFRYDSDHRMIKCEIKTSKQRIYKKEMKKVNKINEEQGAKFCEKMNDLIGEMTETQNVDRMNDQLINVIKKAAREKYPRHQ